VVAQTERLFLNIEQLLADGGAGMKDLQYLIVYLRDVADYSAVNTYLQENFSGIPYLITAARVCRPEWLIEVETVAIS
jgi:enamine deaminase RidA (YjgF/YER057c/UK114 family)